MQQTLLCYHKITLLLFPSHNNEVFLTNRFERNFTANGAKSELIIDPRIDKSETESNKNRKKEYENKTKKNSNKSDDKTLKLK